MAPEFQSDLIGRLGRSRRVTVLTGAGTSAESGVPANRGALNWLREGRINLEELATREGFARDPQSVWIWYAARRAHARLVSPNPGHHALAQLARRFDRFTLITQNVDGLHQQAGSRDVIELHGNIHRVKCFDRGHPVEHWDETAELPPRCPHCNSRLRPDVVWYGETLPGGELERAVKATFACDIIITIGTSAADCPVAGLSLAAIEAGRPLLEINPERTSLSALATWFLAGKSGDVLPALEAALG